MTHPIPAEALDDRLAITGTSGSGKTYAALGALTRLMKRGSRFVAADPLGVMFGLRLQQDGKTPSSLKPVIFGGPHGDLPLTVGAAALIGEAAASMAESVILDLSQLGTKADERRFMLRFLTALERHANREPVHLILDEADLWAPQRVLDKEGDALKLLGRVDNIVRRGRIKGFIPWLITQRPAVLSKDVLSQADGVIAMKLTGSHDRDAIGGWIEGAADRAKGKEILALLPTLDTGEGVIWIPGRQVLKTARFPENQTFDSSRTPKRGESVRKVDLKPLDLGKLKEQLATVEEEAKANDPSALKARIAQLEQAARSRVKVAIAGPQDDAAALRDRERAFAAGQTQGAQTILDQLPAILDAQHENSLTQGYDLAHADLQAALGRGKTLPPDRLPVRKPLPKGLIPTAKAISLPKPPSALNAIFGDKKLMKALDDLPAPLGPITMGRGGSGGASVDFVGAGGGGGAQGGAQGRVLDAIGFWASVGDDAPSRAQVAAVAGYSVSSSSFNNLVGALRTAGQIVIPAAGKVQLAPDVTFTPMTVGQAKDRLLSVLSPSQLKLVNVMTGQGDRAPPGIVSRGALAVATDYSPTSSSFNNLIGSLATLTILTKPEAGHVALSDWAKRVLT